MGKAVIAIHGGAGAISRAQMTPEREREYVAEKNGFYISGTVERIVLDEAGES